MSRQKTPITRIAAKEAAKALMAADPRLSYNQALGEVARKNGYANAQDMIRAYLPSSTTPASETDVETAFVTEMTRFLEEAKGTTKWIISHDPKANPTFLIVDQRNLDAVLEHAGSERLPIVLERAPGTGFTSTLEALCEKTRREVLVIRSSIVSITDLIPQEWLEKIENNPAGVLLFDEFDRADPEVTAFYMDVMSTRTILDVKIPDGWTIMLTGSSDDLRRQTPPAKINAVWEPRD